MHFVWFIIWLIWPKYTKIKTLFWKFIKKIWILHIIGVGCIELHYISLSSIYTAELNMQHIKNCMYTWCLSDWTGGVSLHLGYGNTSLAEWCPTFKTAWWSQLLCLHFSMICDTSILWLISMHSVTCFVANTATVFTYCNHVGSMDIWCHSGTLLELLLLARKSNGPKLLFWNSKFSS